MFAAMRLASSRLSSLAADRRPGSPRNALLGASLIKLRKYGHKFLGFTGFRIDFLQSVHPRDPNTIWTLPLNGDMA